MNQQNKGKKAYVYDIYINKWTCFLMYLVDELKYDSF